MFIFLLQQHIGITKRTGLLLGLPFPAPIGENSALMLIEMDLQSLFAVF